jgi:hypothetical protein
VLPLVMANIQIDLKILKDSTSSKERRGMAEAWLRMHLR